MSWLNHFTLSHSGSRVRSIRFLLPSPGLVRQCSLQHEIAPFLVDGTFTRKICGPYHGALKKFILLGLMVGTSAFAQVSDSLSTVISCNSGRGDADTYYTLEIDKHVADGSLYLSIYSVSDGEKRQVDLVQVTKSTGPTKVEFYVNAANTVQLRLMKKGILSATLTDTRNTGVAKVFTFEECATTLCKRFRIE